MSALTWFLILIGPFLAIGAVGIPAFAQWPRPASARPRFPRPVFAGAPQMAGARW